MSMLFTQIPNQHILPTQSDQSVNHQLTKLQSQIKIQESRLPLSLSKYLPSFNIAELSVQHQPERQAERGLCSGVKAKCKARRTHAQTRMYICMLKCCGMFDGGRYMIHMQWHGRHKHVAMKNDNFFLCLCKGTTACAERVRYLCACLRACAG